jgi:hypothetical protein
MLSNIYLVKACDSSCRKTTAMIRLYRAAGNWEAGLKLAYEMSGNLTLAIEIRTHCLRLGDQTIVGTDLIRGVLALRHSSP